MLKELRAILNDGTIRTRSARLPNNGRQDLEMTKSEPLILRIHVLYPNEQPVKFTATSCLRLSLKQRTSDARALLQVDAAAIPRYGGDGAWMEMTITAANVTRLDPGLYIYDLWFGTKDGSVFTPTGQVIPVSRMTLTRGIGP